MADAPFNHTPIGFLERPVSKDHNQNTSQIYRTLRDVLMFAWAQRVSNTSSAPSPMDGFLGGGFRVVPKNPAAMQVEVSPGFGFVFRPADLPSDIGSPDLLEVDDLSTYKPLVLLTAQTFNVTAPAANPRIDIIEAKVDRRLENSISRRQFDSGLEEFVPHSYFKTLAFEADGRTGSVNDPASSTAGLSYKVGVEAGSPVAPTVTTGYVKIAEVRLAAGATTITASNIGDFRKLLCPGGTMRASISFRLQYNAGAPILTIQKIMAPPSVEIAIDPDASNRGAFRAAIIGGWWTAAAPQVELIQDATSGNVIVPIVKNNVAGIVLEHALDASDQTAYAANYTPAILSAIGVPTASIYVQPQQFVPNAGTHDDVFSGTQTGLEDLRFTVSFDLAFY